MLMHYTYIMRTCTTCKITKEDSEYFFRDKKTGRLHSQCKQCYSLKRRTNWELYYNKHGSKYRENAVKRSARLKAKLRLQMLDYLSDKSCVICGYSDSRALEFDHINPNSKTIGIAKAMSDIWSWNRILEEIDKCQILCANCHKIKTAEEQLWYKKLSN